MTLIPSGGGPHNVQSSPREKNHQNQAWQQDLINFNNARAKIDFNINDAQGYMEAIDALEKLKRDGCPSDLASPEEIEQAISTLEQTRDIPVDPRFPRAAALEKEAMLNSFIFPSKKSLDIDQKID